MRKIKDYKNSETILFVTIPTPAGEVIQHHNKQDFIKVLGQSVLYKKESEAIKDYLFYLSKV